MPRVALDNPSERTAALWDRLAAEYFNSDSFNPVNEQTDVRIVDIDPSRPPEVPISGTNLRKQFSWLRTKMTKLFEDFKRSGQIMEG